jgi:sialidase-1
MTKPSYSLLCILALAALASDLIAADRSVAATAADSLVRHVTIEPATADVPRSDTASIARLSDGRLMVVYHKYEKGKNAGHDHGFCRIWSKISSDGGATWSKAVFSGLEGGESCTCMRRLHGTNKLVLFWNNSKYVKGHHHLGERTPLTAAVSSDAGKTWKSIGRIADDPKAEYANLDCFFTNDHALLTYM